MTTQYCMGPEKNLQNPTLINITHFGVKHPSRDHILTSNHTCHHHALHYLIMHMASFLNSTKIFAFFEILKNTIF